MSILHIHLDNCHNYPWHHKVLYAYQPPEPPFPHPPQFFMHLKGLILMAFLVVWCSVNTVHIYDSFGVKHLIVPQIMIHQQPIMHHLGYFGVRQTVAQPISIFKYDHIVYELLYIEYNFRLPQTFCNFKLTNLKPEHRVDGNSNFGKRFESEYIRDEQVIIIGFENINLMLNMLTSTFICGWVHLQVVQMVVNGG